MATGGITLPRVRWAAQVPAIDRRVLVYAAALACIPLAFAVYWPRLNDYFVWDDFFFLRAVRNHDFSTVMLRAVTFPQSKPFDEATFFWRPLIDLYFYAAKPLGVHAQPFHLVNIGLHGLVGALGIVFLWRLTRSALAAVITGLLFTVVPTYDYAVTWVAQVSELLGAALILAVLISYHAYVTSDERKDSYAVATVAFAILALLTKESTSILVVLLPGLMLAIPAERIRRSRRQLAVPVIVVMMLGIAYAAAMEIREYMQPGHFHSFGLHMARNVWRYLKWMALPYWPGEMSVARDALAAAFLAAGVGALLLRQRVLGFLFVWTIAAIMPFTGFGDWIEFRYTYLPALPFIGFVVCAVVTALHLLPRPVLAPASFLLVAAVSAALIVAPLRTRDQQAWFAAEAAHYELMVDSVRNLCGDMPSESFVYVVSAPYHDLWGIHTPAAVNLYYNRVHAAAVEELPGLTVFIENKCVLQYDAAMQTYARIE